MSACVWVCACVHVMHACVCACPLWVCVCVRVSMRWWVLVWVCLETHVSGRVSDVGRRIRPVLDLSIVCFLSVPPGLCILHECGLLYVSNLFVSPNSRWKHKQSMKPFVYQWFTQQLSRDRYIQAEPCYLHAKHNSLMDFYFVPISFFRGYKSKAHCDVIWYYIFKE